MSNDHPYEGTAGVRTRTGDAVIHINAAKDLVRRIQERRPASSTEWHELELVDDQLHEALLALGD